MGRKRTLDVVISDVCLPVEGECPQLARNGRSNFAQAPRGATWSGRARNERQSAMPPRGAQRHVDSLVPRELRRCPLLSDAGD